MPPAENRPAQRHRLEEIRDNLLARITEAQREGWAGEAEGLKVSLAAANNKLAQADLTAARRAEAVSLGIPLHRDDFTSRFISHGTSGITPMAAIDWAATAALNAGELPCSGGERRILQLAASLAGGIPVDLRDTLTGLDGANTARLLTAIRHATGKRADANLFLRCRHDGLDAPFHHWCSARILFTLT